MQYQRMKKLVSILKRNTTVNWPAIFLSIKGIDCTPPSHDFVRDCAITFFDKLLAIGCSDANILEMILKLYGYHCASKHYCLRYEELTAAFSGYIRAIFHNDSICNCDFNDNVTHFDVDLLEIALRAKDLKFMTALLKYGIDIPRSVSVCQWAQVDLMDFWLHWLYPIGVTQTSLHCVEVWENVCYSGMKRGYRRFCLITKMLKILHIKWCTEKKHIRWQHTQLPTYPVYTDKQFHDSVQCMKLYFRATVEPLISKDDIVEFIASTPIWSGVPEDFLASVAQDYEDLFPEQSNAPYTPRTLQHLCRYSLRESLTQKKVGVLPELVENLFLPKRLKSYLCCEY